MKSLLIRVPWFVGAPAFVIALLVGGLVTNYLGADYFKRTRLDEANPLAGLVAVQDGAAAGVVAKGSFRDGEPGHRGSGEAILIREADGSHTLRFEDFSVTNGPDLFVILSPGEEYQDAGALDLGKLKATDGNINYAIPSGTDVSQFRSAIIWCKKFSTTFAVAGLSQAMAADSGGSTGSPSTTPAPAQSGSASAQSPAANQPPTGGPRLLAQGAFRDGAPGHRGSGKANLGRDAAGKLVLVLEDFSVTNGPDLRVILSPDPEGGGDGLDLGKLKATDGTFSYTIPDGTDLTPYRSVTIFCAAFPTVFAYATLGASQ